MQHDSKTVIMKTYLRTAFLIVALSICTSSIAAARNGYRLVFIDLSLTIDSEISDRLRSYFNSELTPDVYRCALQNRLIEFDLVYMNKRPKTITNDLVADSLQPRRGSLKKIRTALRTYRDTEIDKGFDGLVVFKNGGHYYSITSIGAIDNGYERSTKVSNAKAMDINTLKALFCESLAALPYAYLD